ncbi:uncharacterized protein LOC110453489 isoform X2 [Mizuhopecten yessoensis]|uniref:Uncharacterized protein n=1 Tax=Mizuhopecten yessoensis TaxID=6573 RepID=A0A210QH88_MIZYE|nr:uncharacterized protein LOC110453489 isoform X2 [Mizuhopecten yessoensis]OWF48128.1 hypothetical protein KP79_PYT24716 [Mizuhopecten yessoensis]
MTRVTVLFVCVVFILPMAGALPRYAKPMWHGKCVKYCNAKKQPPRVSGYQVGCVSDRDCTYCKFYSCPEFSVCGNGEVPRPDRSKICMPCPGECLYLGETYAVGETGIMSMDTVNRCVCRGFIPEVVCQKKIPRPPPDVFCEY